MTNLKHVLSRSLFVFAGGLCITLLLLSTFGYFLALSRPYLEATIVIKCLGAAQFLAFLAVFNCIASSALVYYGIGHSISAQGVPAWQKWLIGIAFFFFALEMLWVWSHSVGSSFRLTGQAWEAAKRLGPWVQVSPEQVISSAWLNIRALCALTLMFCVSALIPLRVFRHR